MKIKINAPASNVCIQHAWPFSFAPTVGMHIEFRDQNEHLHTGLIERAGVNLVYGYIEVTVNLN